MVQKKQTIKKGKQTFGEIEAFVVVEVVEDMMELSSALSIRIVTRRVRWRRTYNFRPLIMCQKQKNCLSHA